MSTSPVLVIEHEAICPAGWIGDWLLDDGVALDVRRPYVGEPLPDGLDEHGGLLVLGGSMGAADDHAFPWLTHTKALVRAAAADGTPTLGICLGHQIVAVALGGTVSVNPRGPQVGVLDIGWSDPAYDDPLLAPLTGSARAVQWNNDVVDALPEGAVALARAATSELQAARFGAGMWGVQWHPEVGAEIIGGWADDDRDYAAERGVDVDAVAAEVAAAEQELRTSWRPLATSFAALLTRARDERAAATT